MLPKSFFLRSRWNRGRASAAGEADGSATAVVKLVGTIVAPLTVMLSATFYVAGWEEWRTALARFGLPVDLFNWSLQSTIARGYLNVLAVSLVALPVVAISYISFFGRASKAGPRPDGRFAWLHSAGTWVTRIGRWNLYFAAVLAVLALGEIAGRYAGNVLADGVIDRVSAGCRQGCFIYLTSNRRVTGVLVAADADRAAIYTAAGMILLGSGDIRAVMPYRADAAIRPRPPRGS